MICEETVSHKCKILDSFSWIQKHYTPAFHFTRPGKRIMLLRSGYIIGICYRKTSTGASLNIRIPYPWRKKNICLACKTKPVLILNTCPVQLQISLIIYRIETSIERICAISYIKLFVSITQKGRSYGVSLRIETCASKASKEAAKKKKDQDWNKT